MQEEFCVFRVRHRRFGMPKAFVRTALPLPALTRLPASPRSLIGAMVFDGQPLGVWDPASLLSDEESPDVVRELVLVVDSGRSLFGLWVHSVAVLERSDPEWNAARPVGGAVVGGCVPYVRTFAPDIEDGLEQDASEPDSPSERVEIEAGDFRWLDAAGLSSRLERHLQELAA